MPAISHATSAGLGFRPIGPGAARASGLASRLASRQASGSAPRVASGIASRAACGPAACIAAVGATLLLAIGSAQAQGNSAALAPPATAPDVCRHEVARFEQTIGFIRQSQGNAAAAELKERLLPAKLENEILMKDGYCGLARYLREKKLTR